MERLPIVEGSSRKVCSLFHNSNHKKYHPTVFNFHSQIYLYQNLYLLLLAIKRGEKRKEKETRK